MEDPLSAKRPASRSPSALSPTHLTSMVNIPYEVIESTIGAKLTEPAVLLSGPKPTSGELRLWLQTARHAYIHTMNLLKNVAGGMRDYCGWREAKWYKWQEGES